MSIFRRQLIQVLGAGLIVSRIPSVYAASLKLRPTLKPPRLQVGDTVGLINPAGATFSPRRRGCCAGKLCKPFGLKHESRCTSPGPLRISRRLG